MTEYTKEFIRDEIGEPYNIELDGLSYVEAVVFLKDLFSKVPNDCVDARMVSVENKWSDGYFYSIEYKRVKTQSEIDNEKRTKEANRDSRYKQYLSLKAEFDK